MCFKKKEEPAVTEKDVDLKEEDIDLKEEDIEEVSGGVKWGNGERPTLKDAQNKERQRRK